MHMKKIIHTPWLVLLVALTSFSSLSAQSHWDIYRGQSILFCGSILSVAELSDKFADIIYAKGVVVPIDSQGCCIKQLPFYIVMRDTDGVLIDSVIGRILAPVTFQSTSIVGDTLYKMIFLELSSNRLSDVTTFAFTENSSLYTIDTGFEESFNAVMTDEAHIIPSDDDDYPDVYPLREKLRTVAHCLFCKRANILTNNE